MPSRLRALELHGFKTFANRTLFEFSDRLTVIVGPNGSGKSNITDCIRWVLGEQSFAVLRGKKTEDMIFSGSESRPRAGMVSATITFDNTEAWLPIDYSEVAIARRAYRDGENEYYINDQRVRLKDISDLLSQSGLAERTYMVVGQGLVDLALALKPEERRRLFEEASGIGLYRSRREEALRRLEATRRNLERVQDILAELRPRLQSLERQARKAQEYERIMAELRVLWNEWYGYHWHYSQKNLTEAQKAVRNQEKKLEQAQKESADLEDQIMQLRSRVQRLRTDINSWRQQMAILQSQGEEAKRNLAVAQERKQALFDLQKNLEAEQIQIGEDYGYYQEQYFSTRQEYEQLEKEKEKAVLQAEKNHQELSKLQAERLSIEQKLQSTQEELTKLYSLQSQQKARHSERRNQIEKIANSMVVVAKTVEGIEQELRGHENNLRTALIEEAQSLETRKKAESTYLAHRQQIETLELERKVLGQEHATIISKLAQIKAQEEVLQQAEVALIGYALGAKHLLEAGRQERLQGIKGALIHFLEVPAELEVPISASLGEYLDSILLEVESEKALELIEKQPGRSILLPLEELKLVKPLKVEKQFVPDVLGVASDFVKSPPELRSVVNLLLGQVLIVRDRKTARQVLVDQPIGVRAVTLKGEVFHASGPIFISGLNQKEGQTLLGRSRQIRELTQERTQGEKKLVEYEKQLKVLDEELQSKRSELSILEEKLEKARLDWANATMSTSQTRVILEQAKHQLAWQGEQQKRLETEYMKAKQEAEELSRELEQLEVQITQAKGDIKALNNQLSNLDLDDVLNRVAHWDTAVAVAQRAVEGVQARQAEQQEILNKLERNRATNQGKLEEVGAKLESLTAEIVVQEKLTAEKFNQVHQVQSFIEPAERELLSLEKEQEKLDEEAVKARNGLKIAEQLFSQTRINLVRRQEELQSLRKRIEDDLGLVAFEYEDQISGPTPLPLEGLVEHLPKVDKLNPETEETISQLRTQLKRLGAINQEAFLEFEEVKQRYEFLSEQLSDLIKAEKDIQLVIVELDSLMEREFQQTFQAVAEEFKEMFTRLFNGGSARLVLTEPQDLTVTGVDIEVRLPGRRSQGLSLLSGGERSLTATALIFALLKVSPTPFCILDEVDAMLDEVNVGRFLEVLLELSRGTQFVVITHNRNTVQVADVIYGITMGSDSVSQVLSLKLDEVDQIAG